MRILFVTFPILFLTSLAIGQNAEKRLNKTLILQLDTILLDDQFYRVKSDSLAQKYGYESKEMQTHYQEMYEKDSINTLKVASIIDKFGWLGSGEVGESGNLTLFLVIQHSDIKTQ